MQAVQEQLSALAEKIQSLNLVLAMPELEAVERDVLSRALWDALDEEAELYNQLSSLSTPEPELVPEQVTPEPETQPEPIAVEDAQKENDQNQENDQSTPEPVPGYIIEKVKTDIKQYTEQLEVFDKAIQTAAFAELPEADQASRFRARDHLADYLEESKAELESFGPLFDELNVIEPAEELEQAFEQQNALCDRCDWSKHNWEQPYKPTCCDCKIDNPDLPDRIIPTQDQLKKAILGFIAGGQPGYSLETFEMNFKLHPWSFEPDREALSVAVNALYESGRILKTDYGPNDKYTRGVLYWILPDASREWNPEPDLASDFDVLFNSEPEPEIAQAVSDADELADLQAKVNQAKAMAEKNKQLQAEKTVIESELVDLERQLEQIFAGGYNEFSDIEAAKIQREIEVRQRCKREIMAHFESPDSIVPAWAKWQDRIDELTPSPEPEVLEPVSDEAIKNLASVIRGGLQSLVNEKIQERSEPAKPKKPAVKPVKVDLIGTVTPTPEQLREAVLEILGRDPGFANYNTLELNLAGAPWCFDVDQNLLREVTDALWTENVIHIIENENGIFWTLASLFADEPRPEAKSEAVCHFCNSPAKETPGQLLWKCTKNEAHYFYVGDKNGVWRNAENKDIESVTVPLPVWTKSAVPHKFDPRCEYCNGDMQAINGNPGQWRCLGNIYHSFYVSNGRGVWVDNSGTFDKQITEMPSWAKKEG